MGRLVEKYLKTVANRNVCFKVCPMVQAFLILSGFRICELLWLQYFPSLQQITICKINVKDMAPAEPIETFLFF